MSESKTCKECIWYNVHDTFEFCDGVRACGRDSCTKFYPASFKEECVNKEVECIQCNRKRDPRPNKCWWCGSE